MGLHWACAKLLIHNNIFVKYQGMPGIALVSARGARGLAGRVRFVGVYTFLISILDKYHPFEYTSFIRELIWTHRFVDFYWLSLALVWRCPDQTADHP